MNGRDQTRPVTHAAIIHDAPNLAAALARAAAAGHTHVELEAALDRPPADLDALADAGLFVACVRLDRDWGAEDVERRRLSLQRQKRLLADAGLLGATVALLLPPTDGLAHFVEACELLAAFALGRGVRLAVLPRPGTVIPDATAIAALPEAVGLALHETDDPAAAGDRLLYVRHDVR